MAVLARTEHQARSIEDWLSFEWIEVTCFQSRNDS